jgi:hypothetical protein
MDAPSKSEVALELLGLSLGEFVLQQCWVGKVVGENACVLSASLSMYKA